MPLASYGTPNASRAAALDSLGRAPGDLDNDLFALVGRAPDRDLAALLEDGVVAEKRIRPHGGGELRGEQHGRAAGAGQGKKAWNSHARVKRGSRAAGKPREGPQPAKDAALDSPRRVCTC